jgi:probable phosphoglycerate mutase
MYKNTKKKHNIISKNKLKSNKLSSVKEIYLIRHGQTDLNKMDMYQGQEIDSLLNNDGRAQAEKTGKYLNEYRIKDKPFDCIYSSPMMRAKETCEIICKEINYNNIVNIKFNDLFLEAKKGSNSGKTKEETMKVINEIKKEIRDPIEQYRVDIIELLNNKMNIGAETDTELTQRCIKIINMIKKSKYKKILIVSHSGTIFRLIKTIFNLNWTPMVDGGNCCITYITYSGNKFKLESPPNTEHLKM